MLEYDFNELDNDFVTIWSKFLLTEDKAAIVNEIEALAELGQINAVQSWFLVRQGRPNKIIDEIVSNYNASNFNQLWAMATSRDMERVDREFEEAREWAEDYSEEYFVSTEYALARYLQENCDYFRYMKAAIDMAIKISIGNIFTHERAAEMIYAYAGSLPISESGQYKRAKQALRIAKDVKKEIKKTLSKKEDAIEFLKEDPQLAFVVAKNYGLFSEKQKEKQFAAELLKYLSNREFSTSLTDKIAEIKQRKMKSIGQTLMSDEGEQEYISLIRRMYREGSLDRVVEQVVSEGTKPAPKATSLLSDTEEPITVVTPDDVGV